MRIRSSRRGHNSARIVNTRLTTVRGFNRTPNVVAEVAFIKRMQNQKSEPTPCRVIMQGGKLLPGQTMPELKPPPQETPSKSYGIGRIARKVKP